MAPVVNIQNTPVSSADIIVKENRREHALVDQTDHRTVLQRDRLPCLDRVIRYEGVYILGKVRVVPLAILIVDLTLLLIQERIFQLQTGGGKDLHVALASYLRPAENDILARLLLLFKEDQTRRLRLMTFLFHGSIRRGALICLQPHLHLLRKILSLSILTHKAYPVSLYMFEGKHTISYDTMTKPVYTT